VTDPGDKNVRSIPPTSLGLLERAKAGAQDSWAQLTSLYTPLVYHWCRKAGLGRNDSEDVGQEVLTVVFEKIREFRRDQEGYSFRGWLYGITEHKIQDHWRKSGKNPEAKGGSDGLVELLNYSVSPSNSIAVDVEDSGLQTDEKSIIYRQALKQLESKFKRSSWQVFLRLAKDGLTPKEVAAEFGIKVAAVHSIKSRILRRFREEYASLVAPDFNR
jgi:RNA polymerase sigma-70 factor (ECF subfamily)